MPRFLWLEVVTPSSTTQAGELPTVSYCKCLFNIFSATLHIFSIHNLRTSCCGGRDLLIRVQYYEVISLLDYPTKAAHVFSSVTNKITCPAPHNFPDVNKNSLSGHKHKNIKRKY
jgi:hypothetical protein